MTTADNRKKKVMAGTVCAQMWGGMLELLAKVKLPEGTEVLVTILGTPEVRSSEGPKRSAGAWKGLVNAEKLIENIYADRLISTRPVPRLWRDPLLVSRTT